jgi:pyocin large subunit-like protein
LTNEQKDYATMIREKYNNPEPTQEIKIDGVGIIKVYGKWNVEKIIKKLLEYEEFNGG